MSRLVNKAAAFATRAHKSQKRKYTGEPYTVHLMEVAQLVKDAGLDERVQAAAWLHDTLEDTTTTPEQLRREFGDVVASLVLEVTDVSKPGDGNRAMRKALDAQHLAGATFSGQSIKYADLISNTSSIVAHDKDFAKVYLREKAHLLDVMKGGSQYLRKKVERTLKQAQQELENYYVGKHNKRGAARADIINPRAREQLAEAKRKIQQALVTLENRAWHDLTKSKRRVTS